MSDRTTEDKMLASPITATLAGKEYEIKPLPRRAAREWRKKDEEYQRSVVSIAETPRDKFDQEALDGLMELQYGDPDKIAELVIAYSPEIPRDVIWDEATDAEVLGAYMSCRMLANPYRAFVNLDRMSSQMQTMTKPTSTAKA